MKSPTAAARPGHHPAESLKGTILKIASVQIAATCLILWFRADLLNLWETPLRAAAPNYPVRNVGSGEFVFWLEFVVLAGLPLVVPWHVYFVIRLANPDLPPKRNIRLIACLGASSLVFLGGFWVAYAWFLPAMLGFYL